MPFYSEIESVLSDNTGRPFKILDRRPIGGGCISNAEQLKGANASYFLKTNRESFLEFFEQESDSLKELAASQTFKIPKPLAFGIADGRSYLVLEYIQPGSPRADSWARFGRQLAHLHEKQYAYFGWHRDNVIGATHQPNRKSDQWIDFFRERRLLHQIKLALENGLNLIGSDRLLEQLPSFFNGYSPYPSLLHGDLWSGNAAFDTDGDPYIFDPCCYYGDRETDLAFTEFFGGFHTDFYAAYNETHSLDSGYTIRKTLYNLYHCLNHYNLFGSSYANQAQAMTNQLLSEL